GPTAKSPNPNSCGSHSNMRVYMAACIPFARNHDASFYSGYGNEHTVDVHAIFPNFDADVHDPASYDFVCTDNYILTTEAAGTETFYRLGSRIEHEIKKYGTVMPKDFQKWAEICEHIIRHYTEGWADGYHLKLRYWEIWNEPDLDPDDATDKRCWSGTRAQFFEFFHVAATHLKACFPHLKIGGPAIAGNMEWAEAFLAQLKAPIDFFSWHIYAHEVEKIADKAKRVRDLLDQYGYHHVESILNEWNYVLGWRGDDIIYSHIAKRKLKGAAFTLGTMCACQQGGALDMLMYYDARPTAWNGLFDFSQLGKCTLKGYYPFVMFNTLYRLGESVAVAWEEPNLYACAARNETDGALVLTHFNDTDQSEPKDITLELCGYSNENGTELEIYLLDEEHDLTLKESIVFYGDRLLWKTKLPNFTSYLLKLKKA
ncbi:MAG: hypothetical protein J6W14_00195, partial [Clostridia bacterium]|nr:hypothetical protein [Clostridia bacterium]